MLGLPDIWILLAYLFSVCGAALCVIYGIVNWNKDGDSDNGGDGK